MSNVGGTSSRSSGTGRQDSARASESSRATDTARRATATETRTEPPRQTPFARDTFTRDIQRSPVDLHPVAARQTTGGKEGQTSTGRKEAQRAQDPQTPTVTPEDVEAARQDLPDAVLSRPPAGVTQTREVMAQNTQLQTALNELGYVADSHVTGTFASITEGAIKAFQYEHGLEVTGTFDADTREAMAQALAEKRAAEAQGITPPAADLPDTYTPITDAQLAAIMPGATAEQREKYLGPLNDAMEEFGITTPERQAAFLAQVAQETGDLQYMEEIAKNPDHGDYYGRGLLQLTHEGNYREAGDALGVDLVGNPDQVATDPELAARTAAWYFSDRGLNELADQGKFGRITLLINGGYNGVDRRLEAYDVALRELRPAPTE